MYFNKDKHSAYAYGPECDFNGHGDEFPVWFTGIQDEDGEPVALDMKHFSLEDALERGEYLAGRYGLYFECDAGYS